MKIRLDQYLVQHGMIQSRERAKALIMAGVVFVNEQKVDKAGEMIKEDAKVEVRGHDIGYVSRGGLKLEKAMQCFPLTPNGKVCMDIGASTGGFTDCMLQNGAVKVYAVDVGYGQLAWSLRTDERIISSRWRRLSRRPTQWVSASSSLSSRLAARRWVKTVLSATLPPTAKCSTMRWDMPLQTVSSCADWISAPSKALRATLST